MKLAYPFLTEETISPLLGYRGKQEDIFPILRKLGYDSVELLIRDPSKIDIVAMKQLMNDNNLEIAAVSTAPIVSDDQLTFTSVHRDQREAAIKRVKEVIDLAAQVNCPVHIGKLRGNLIADAWETSYEWMCQGFREVGEYAHIHGVDIAIEPQNDGNLNNLNTATETLTFINTLNVPSLKIMLDTYHMNISEESIYTSLIKAQEKLVFIHLADDNREVPGNGSLRFKKILQTLQSINYKGCMSMEIKQHPTSYEVAKRAIEHIAASKGC